MNYKVVITYGFKKQAKKLSKKHVSLRADIESLIASLENNPTQGEPLGKDCYKVRMAISSKGKGKSGGSRVITCVKITAKNIYLLSIYDKSLKEDITDSELNLLLKLAGIIS